MYAAAKFHEAGGLVALHEETENFVHGMNYLVEPGDVVSLIAPTDSSTFRAKELVKGLTDLNAVVVGISDIDLGASFHLPLPKSAPLLTPFLESLGSQVLCHTVAHHLSLSLEENRAGRDNGQMCKHVQAKWMQETRIS
jgi:fructoselysine-6-P-deglycase FrlB-like protein